jgi:hypothetical protein
MVETLSGPTVDVVAYHLRFSRPASQGEATQLRGYFGRQFSDEVLLHHHNADGSLRYDYPKVQFKVLDRTAHLIGLAEGCDVVTRLWAAVDQAVINHEMLPVLEANLTRRREQLGEAPAPVRYRFRTPWLGLNQENHRRYREFTDEASRRELLGRVLVGNCLALAGAFGHRVAAGLTADPGGLRRITTRFKGVPMVAFIGTFRINFRLPNLAGIGKSVSRGFGTVENVGG